MLVATGAPIELTRRGGAGCLHYPATFPAPLHDHVNHRHRPPGAARRRTAEVGPGRAAGGGGSAGPSCWPASPTRPCWRCGPGVVTPDTKTYLYLDPTRFLSQVAFMWNPTVGLGGVTHEYIGYLLPMGPFFAVFHVLRRARVGGAAPLAGLHPLRRRSRRPLPLSHPRAARAGADGRRPGLHALAVLPAVRRADLGDLAALGRTALHAGADHRRPPARRLARAGPVRRGGGGGQRHQRQLHHLCRCRARPVDPLRRRGPAGGDLASRARHGTAHRHPDPGDLPVVDGRARGGGRLRRQRPQVHRDRPLDVGHLEPRRHHPGPRLLVLLRDRPHRAVDQCRHPVHAGDLAPGHLLRRAGGRSGGGRVRALARARLLPPAPLRGPGPLRRARSPSPTPP